MGVEHISCAGVEQSSTGVPKVEEPSSFLAKFTLFTGVSKRIDGGTRAEAASLDENSEGKLTEKGLLAFSERLLTDLGTESTKAWTSVADFSCFRFSAQCIEPREKLLLNDRDRCDALAGSPSNNPTSGVSLVEDEAEAQTKFLE